MIIALNLGSVWDEQASRSFLVNARLVTTNEPICRPPCAWIRNVVAFGLSKLCPLVSALVLKPLAVSMLLAREMQECRAFERKLQCPSGSLIVRSRATNPVFEQAHTCYVQVYHRGHDSRKARILALLVCRVAATVQATTSHPPSRCSIVLSRFKPVLRQVRLHKQGSLSGHCARDFCSPPGALLRTRMTGADTSSTRTATLIGKARH